MACLLFLIATFFGGINSVSSACTECSPDCTSLSMESGRGDESLSFSCNNEHFPTLTLLKVSDADSHADGFTVTVMDGDNHQKYTNGQPYSYAANVGTGAVGRETHTCYQNESIDYKQAAGTTVYIVIYCNNILEDCHLKYKAVESCTPTDPCLGVNCNHGTCFGGVCKCHDGYTGANCDQNPCAGVNCINGNCSSGKCQCYGGYTGANCDVAPDPCADVSCGDHGTCSGGLCNCDEGYNGPPCTLNRLGHDSFGKAKLIAIISGSGGAFLIIVVTVGFLFIRRYRRRRRGMTAANETLLGDKAMTSEPFTATT